MNYAMMPHQGQRSEHLAREPTNERRRETRKTIRLDQLVQVDTQELHRNAQMISEVKMFSHLDNVVLFIRVL